MKNPVGLLFVTANVRKTRKKQKVQTISWGQWRKNEDRGTDNIIFNIIFEQQQE